MNNIIKLISSIIIISTLITTNAFCNEKSIKAGEDRLETSISIANKVSELKKSNSAILVNEDGITSNRTYEFYYKKVN